MYNYKIYYGESTSNYDGFLLLGEIKYPYELRFGDVVIIGENYMNKIKEAGIKQFKQQFRVGSVHHWIDPIDTASVYLVSDEKYIELQNK